MYFTGYHMHPHYPPPLPFLSIPTLKVMITKGCVAKLAAVKRWYLATATTFTGTRSEVSVCSWVYMVLVLISRESDVDTGPKY